MSKFSDINKFDLINIRADIDNMAAEDLGVVILLPADADGECQYSHLDTLTLAQFQQGGYVNSYSSKQSLINSWYAA